MGVNRRMERKVIIILGLNALNGNDTMSWNSLQPKVSNDYVGVGNALERLQDDKLVTSVQSELYALSNVGYEMFIDILAG